MARLAKGLQIAPVVSQLGMLFSVLPVMNMFGRRGPALPLALGTEGILGQEGGPYLPPCPGLVPCPIGLAGG